MDAGWRPGGSNTTGGPRRDRHSHILDALGDPIPGLYGAGELPSLPWRRIKPVRSPLLRTYRRRTRPQLLRVYCLAWSASCLIR